MFHPHSLLISFCRLVGSFYDATAVSLYLTELVEITNSRSNSLLLHGHGGPAVPELADEASARRLAGSPGSSSDISMRPSETPAGRLFRIPITGFTPPLAGTNPQGVERRRTSDRRPSQGPDAALWIALRFEDEASALHRLGPVDSTAKPHEIDTGLLQFAALLTQHSQHMAGLLQDTLTELPGRLGLQATLVAFLGSARRHHRPVSLVLAAPADLAEINDRHGRDAGDELLRKIAEQLVATLREHDPVHRYGGGVFAVTLADTTESDAISVAMKLRRSLDSIRLPAIDESLRFGLGVAQARPAEDESPENAAIDLLRRADRALSAAQVADEPGVVSWEPRTMPVSARDRLSGIFTADPAKDYRNMLLLWEMVALIGSREGPEALANQVIDRLRAAFLPRSLVLLIWQEDSDSRIFRGTDPETGTLNLCHDREDLLKASRRSETARTLRGSARLDDAGVELVECFAVPLIADGSSVGCLWVEFESHAKLPDATDVFFLETVASELAGAMDRLDDAKRERTRIDQERQYLKSELDELQRALQHANLVYRSPAMEKLLDRARRAAPTDATVLITGESGTGKEVLARTVHQLSNRRSRALVIVDCGAIAASLIDSELFGHQKGAYTGAEEHTPGRLAEGAGGTVVLDEIGELPMPVQSKLLRFVETKQITPVGGATPREVDVRIIALTNRDLSAEVENGSFRADLYFRLRVVHLEVPSLATRPMDVPELADHFLNRFASQYKKPVPVLGTAASELLRTHHWPGNVRELENRILQAVILSEGNTLTPIDLGFEPGAAAAHPDPMRTDEMEGDATGEKDESHLWKSLAAHMSHELREAALVGPRNARPIGRWLADDLLMIADSASNGVTRQGASLLGLAETTYRRRLGKLQAGRSPAGIERSPTWERCRSVLSELVLSSVDRSPDLVRQAQDALLVEILARWPSDVRLGSALLGVSQPTFRSRAGAVS